MKPIWRFVMHHVRELLLWFDWRFITVNSGMRVLFLDDNHSDQIRRGVMFVTDQPDPFALYVNYRAYNRLTGCHATGGTFVLTAEKHTRWTYGWCKTAEMVLRAAEALK